MKKVTSELCRLSWVLSVVFTSIGCVADVDEQADGEQVGTAEQAFAGYSGWAWQTDDHTTPAHNIGSDTTQTCFLSGVAGNLNSENGAPTPPGNQPYAGAFAGVYRASGNWYIKTYGFFNGVKVKATAICLPTTTNRTEPVSWGPGVSAQVLAPVTAHRRCGLTAVFNGSPHNDDDEWQASGDGVQIWEDGTNWYIGGTGNASGRGACVDVSPTSGTGNWVWAPTNGNNTLNLVQLVDNGTSPLGTQCFLTGVGGRFQSSSWTDGVFINYDPGSHWWSMTVSNGKTGRVSCFQ